MSTHPGAHQGLIILYNQVKNPSKHQTLLRFQNIYLCEAEKKSDPAGNLKLVCYGFRDDVFAWFARWR